MNIRYNGINLQNAVQRSLPIWGDLEGWNAKELDEENGMYYYSARYYAPPTFISRDPKFEDYPSISPYTYCANNPLIMIDPTGEDWFQNELTGEVYFNSEVGKNGAGTGNMSGEGWKWMGDNNMMGTVDNNFVNQYHSLAQEGGGTVSIFNAFNENGVHDGYEMNFGSNSEQFMNQNGYEKQPTQYTEYSNTTTNQYPFGGGNSISITTGSKIQINEKYGYVKSGTVPYATTISNTLPGNFNALTGTETVSRKSVHYLSGYLGFAINVTNFCSQMGGSHDYTNTKVLSSWKQYAGDNSLINAFKRLYGTR